MRESDQIAESIPKVPTATLGRTGLKSTKIGLGSGNWIAKNSDEDFIAIMQEAYRLGIRHLDTAPLYGQERFGRLLKQSDPPDDILVITKVGSLMNEDRSAAIVDFDPDLVERTVELDLEQLGMEHLPVVLLHDLEP